MLKLRDGIVELYRKVVTSLPPDVEEALREALGSEEAGTDACQAMEGILKGTVASRGGKTPVCMDTGLPVFFVSVPLGLSHVQLVETIAEATRIATTKVPLCSSAVDTLTGKNTGDNTGDGFPLVHLSQSPNDMLIVDLMLRCSENENIGRIYSLPDEDLGADRNLEGIAKCAMDAVRKAQGKGCPPYIVGIGAGATREQVAGLAQRQFLRKLSDKAEKPEVAELEENLLKEINALGTGPLGKGGRTTAIGVKVGLNHRLPSSFMVDVNLGCWADRRGRLIW